MHTNNKSVSMIQYLIYIRLKQKIKKKATIQSCSSRSTLGTPSSPPSSSETLPPSSVNCNKGILSSNESQLLSSDEALFTYNEDERSGFEMEDGKKLEGNELITYLKECNRTLAKAKLYQHKFEDIHDMNFLTEVECTKKINKIHAFYLDVLYYSNSRSALMVKMALGKEPQ